MDIMHFPVSANRYIMLQEVFKASVSRTYDKTGSQETLVKHAVDGSLKLFDALALHDLLRTTRPKKILEIGTYLGFSLAWILDSTADYAPEVTSLDPRIRHRIFDNLKSHVQDFVAPHKDRVKYIDACFSEKNNVVMAGDYFRHNPVNDLRALVDYIEGIPVVTEPFDEFDFVFVDGEHTYRATVLDVTLAARMMPKGGYIVVHDAITWADVQPALRAICSIPGMQFMEIAGLKIHQFLANNQILKTMPDSFVFRGSLCDGLGIIRVEPGVSIDAETVARLLERK